MSRRRASGFTLLEVLVALAVLALAVTAAVRSNALGLTTAETVRLKLLADWVAENRLEEHRARRDWLALGVSEGVTRQGGESLGWRESVTETPNPRFRRVEVQVFRDGAQREGLTRLEGFVVRTDP